MRRIRPIIVVSCDVSPVGLTAIALSCREPPFAENAADEVRGVRGASAPGLKTGPRSATALC